MSSNLTNRWFSERTPQPFDATRRGSQTADKLWLSLCPNTKEKSGVFRKSLRIIEA